MLQKISLLLLIYITLSSCASRKDIHYLQDAEMFSGAEINYQSATIQPNDILKITVESNIPEAARPYNRSVSQVTPIQDLQLLKLDGYLVDLNGMIDFPVLGKLSTKNKTTQDFAAFLKEKLESGSHLNNANVMVRLLNAKFTVLGEVNQPGTYNFTEQNITLLQALGYAGDLTINGKREDIILTREVEGVRKITHIDLTNSDFMNSPFYFIMPNDVIVVNQNNPRVKEAGFIGNIGTILTIASLGLSVTILLTR